MRKHSLLPRQVNVCFLHDSEPSQQRLQVVLTGQVVIQSLRIRNGILALNTTFCVMTVAHSLRLYSLTVMICALSSGERLEAFGFMLNSR